MDIQAIKTQLQAYWKTLPVNNTHCHYAPDAVQAKEMSLHRLVGMTYCGAQCPPFDDTPAGWAYFFDRMETNAGCQWLMRACGELYGGGAQIGADNWQQADAAVRAAYAADPARYARIMQDVCRYEHLVLDDHLSPGAGHGLAGVRPAFRVDMFLYGRRPDRTDFYKNSAYDYFETTPRTLEEYVQQMEQAVQKKIQQNGCCALKLAVAYERGLNFTRFDAAAARQAFMNPADDPALDKAFGDYIADCLCKIAARYDIPCQIHTGLGRLKETGAMQLLHLVGRNPDTKFVLFHCSFPWWDDALALGRTFQNVYPDLCWLPLLSTAAARAFLLQALETMDAHRLMWGCDTITGEESYGALLAIRQVLTDVLAQQVAQKTYTLEQAKRVGRYILHDNAQRLYGF